MLLAGLAIIRFVFPRVGRHRRDRIIAAWSARLLRVCGVRVSEHPAPGARPLREAGGASMLLANHISWIAVFLVLAVCPAHFVAKMEVARWPLVGALVAGVDTLFVERGRRRAVHQLNDRIENMLRAQRCVAVFPEGTTSDGERLLQFHGNLVEPALRVGVPVIPVAIRYRGLDGKRTDAVDFVGETTLGESMSRLLGARGVLAELHPLPAVTGETRQQVVARAREAMAERLGVPLDDEVSETLRQARAGDQV
jgi:1-acyl-sn-glycerol-3-phosphate acyltransferase